MPLEQNKEWDRNCELHAFIEGYMLADFELTGLVQIQKLDQNRIDHHPLVGQYTINQWHNSDSEALTWVKRRTRYGKPQHVVALKLHERDAPKIEEIIRSRRNSESP